MMKYVVRQQRYWLKHEFFDPFPLHLVRKTSRIKSTTEMENQLSTLIEGEPPKSATKVVADVLDKNTKKNQFLQNVSIQTAQRMFDLQNVEAELEVEKRANAELRSIVNKQREQMADLSKQVQETEQARIKNQEENKKKQAELEAKLELLLGQNRAS
uniref:Uncharacterized protein n=1 Tax=Setaria viridis TaxID=4556 RepID=A0A4U6V0N3_SETVI|nr:hypothetical protein SEVIR_4G232100v2 [Setaria viridis]